MGIRQFLARHPNRLDTRHPLFIEDLLKLAEGQKQEAVKACLQMCEDLYHNGNGSQYIHALEGSALFELKTSIKDSQNSCARVYFYWRNPSEAVLLHAEATPDGQASVHLLNGCAAVWMADLQGQRVLDGWAT